MNWTGHFISSTVVAELSLTWSLFPLQHLIHRAANSSWALHHEASLPCLLQEDMSQQYRLHQPSCTHGGLISPWLFLSFFFFLSPFEILMDTDISINRKNYFLECQRCSLRSSCMVWVQLKIYRNIMVIITFPVFNVTSFKQWIQLLVYPAWTQ